MSPTRMLIGSSIAFVIAASLVATVIAPPAPPLRRVVSELRRTDAAGPQRRRARRWAEHTADGVAERAPSLLPADVELRLIGRRRDTHVLLLAAAALLGLVAPMIVVGVLHAAGVVSPSIGAPLGVGVVGMIAAPASLHVATMQRARLVRLDLRYQLSAYLDVVTMLLAGDSGHEGALDQAAHAGDGRLFAELRRRAREAAATGRSLVHALDAAGRELGVEELRQVAATASLSANEGAPVARTLAAKCATLRSTLATEQEAEARLRTSRLSTPVVGMALVFMALVIYPALTFP